jgi:hypothetical protein
MLETTIIGSVTLRIQRRSEPGAPPTYLLSINSVGQPDLSLALHCRDISLGDDLGNGHDLPEFILSENLTP